MDFIQTKKIDWVDDYMNRDISQRNPIAFSRLKDRKNSFLFCAMFFLPLIAGFVNEIFSIIGFLSISQVTYVIIYGLSVYVYFIALVQNFKKTAGYFSITLFCLLFHSILYPKVGESLFNFSDSIASVALSNFFLLFFMCLSIFWISLCLNKDCIEFIAHYCTIFSYLVVVLYLLTMFLQFGSSYQSNYMTIAYNAMPALIVLLYYGFEKKKLLAILLFVVSAFFIFIGGCRGALLQICVAVILYYFCNGTLLRTKRILILLSALFVSAIVYFYFNQIVSFIGEVLDNIGFSSRVVKMLLGSSAEGGVLHFDDRAEVYEKTIQAMTMWGNGIFVYPIGIGYPHNIALEFILAFGYVLGVLLLFSLLILIFKSFKGARHSKNRFLIIVWVSAFSTIFVKLMLSASFLTDRPFWFYFSFMLFIIRIERVQVND